MTSLSAYAGLITLVVPMVLLWWQTSAVAKQTETLTRQTQIANSTAGVQVHDAAVGSLRAVLLQLAGRPELRPYFYEMKQCPARGARRRTVQSLAEVFADVLETGLAAQRWAPDTGTLINWRTYCQYLLTTSPILRDTVRQWPAWWPDLAQVQTVADDARPPGATRNAGQRVP
jgi:hypothetical protein